MVLEKVGPKWIEINLDQFKTNISTISQLVAPAKVIPVIKANAYGHGALAIARVLENDPCPTLAVATLSEAINLRKNLIKKDILLFGVIPISEIQDLVNYRITPTICTPEFAQTYAKLCKQFGHTAPYHFYIDTGMGRMGYSLEQSSKMFKKIQKIDNLELNAIYSHFSVSDEIDENSLKFTKNQFNKLQSFICENDIACDVHIANSGGILQHSESYMNYVRPGLCSYGVNPNSLIETPDNLKPIMKIKCKPLFVKTMQAGDSVGYGRETVLGKTSNIMTLPIGYGDGLPRSLARSLKVSINNKPYPIAGRICMDMTMVDLGNDSYPLDCEVTLLGSEHNSIYDWSSNANMIPYEVLTRLGQRWSYVYYENNQIKDIIHTA
jgi:alanine racemase